MTGLVATTSAWLKLPTRLMLRNSLKTMSWRWFMSRNLQPAGLICLGVQRWTVQWQWHTLKQGQQNWNLVNTITSKHCCSQHLLMQARSLSVPCHACCNSGEPQVW